MQKTGNGRKALRTRRSFAIVLSLATTHTQRSEMFEAPSAMNEGVDELHAVPHNLASLLLTNTTICR